MIYIYFVDTSTISFYLEKFLCNILIIKKNDKSIFILYSYFIFKNERFRDIK